MILERVAARDRDGAGGDVARPDLDAQRHAAHLPLVELPGGALFYTIIELDAATARQLVGQPLRRGQHALIALLQDRTMTT